MRPLPKLLIRILACCAWAASNLAVGPAAAADMADRPVRIVVPFSAGGLADVLARVVAARLGEQMPQGVIVENHVGAGGNIGAELVWRAAPDGSTLLVSSPGPIVINQGLYPALPFDPTRWAPVSILGSVPNALIVSPKLPVRTAQEFIAYVKAHPGQVTYATQGNGTTSHLTGKLFELLTGTPMVQVPYKGDAPALTDLAGGQVDVFFGSVGAALALHRSGKVRILAVADGHRAAALPELPTLEEAGLKGMRSVTWYAMVAPPATPPTVRDSLNAGVSKALSDPATRERFGQLGLDVEGGSVADTAQFLQQETVRWQKLIRDAHVTLD